MGIQGLLTELRPVVKRATLQDLAGKRAAVDALCWCAVASRRCDRAFDLLTPRHRLHRGIYTCALELGQGRDTDKYGCGPGLRIQRVLTRGPRPQVCHLLSGPHGGVPPGLGQRHLCVRRRSAAGEGGDGEESPRVRGASRRGSPPGSTPAPPPRTPPHAAANGTCSSREAARKRAYDYLAKGQRDAARKYFAKAVDVTPEMCAQFMKVGDGEARWRRASPR